MCRSRPGSRVASGLTENPPLNDTMRLKTELKIKSKWKRLAQCVSFFGIGNGEYPSRTFRLEDEAIIRMAAHLAPDSDRNDTIMKRNISALCVRGRRIEESGNRLTDGQYIVYVLADGKKHQMRITIKG